MAKLVRPEDFRNRVLISADLDEHRAHVQRYVDMGFDEIHYNVGRNQAEFIEVFGRHAEPEAPRRRGRHPDGSDTTPNPRRPADRLSRATEVPRAVAPQGYGFRCRGPHRDGRLAPEGVRNPREAPAMRTQLTAAFLTGALLTALLPALPVSPAVRSMSRPRDRDGDLHQRVLPLPFEASHVALRWTGVPGPI